MQAISEPDIRARIERDNPWWNPQAPPLPEAGFRRRVYLEPFQKLALNFSVRRAAILLGPRRVGKTVMIKQTVYEAMSQGIDPANILYASIDTPLYSGLSLESFLKFLPGAPGSSQCVVIFDEIQYLKDWETHLKDLIDSYPHIKFIASGSAAAALRLKSRESGAGRFSEFMLSNISMSSGLAAPTIKRYIEYLESAFLVMKVSTVDDNCRTLQRERNFKIYLNNPSMRAALFAPVTAEDTQLIGHLAESAVFSQWQHAPSFRLLRYARWRNEGEVDVVCLGADNGKPSWIGEIKWSDRIRDNFDRETKAMQTLARKHQTIGASFFTTKTITQAADLEGRPLNIWPTALYCYIVGRNITSNLNLFFNWNREPQPGPQETEDA